MSRIFILLFQQRKTNWVELCRSDCTVSCWIFFKKEYLGSILLEWLHTIETDEPPQRASIVNAVGFEVGGLDGSIKLVGCKRPKE